MHRIVTLSDVIPRVLCAGVTAKIVSGEKLMFSLVTLAPSAVVREHSHPHEQMGMVLSGSMELTVAGETRTFAGSEIYVIPGGVPHAAEAGPGGAVALDAFAPPREDYLT
jgi:quercetin dioxygenase-like cupin family protein